MNKTLPGMFAVTSGELRHLIRPGRDPEARTKRILLLVTVLLTPITLAGSLLGYVRAYRRFELPYDQKPVFYPMRPIVRVAMILWAILAWAVLGLILWGLVNLVPEDWLRGGFLLYYFGVNLFVGMMVYFIFLRWKRHVLEEFDAESKFGSARFARPDELMDFWNKKGFYIGGGHTFDNKGHILTVAGTRGGKGTSLIIPNLLGVGGYSGSWVVIDPKGENAAITARYQRECGQNVVVLNPWQLLSEHIGEGQSYNPLDILSDTHNINLVDDAQMIAEMIVPIEKNDHNKFFTDNARAIIAGLLLHMVTYEDEPIERTLTTLWRWVRLPEDEWLKLIEDMNVNDHELFGNVVKQAANEIEKLMKAGDKTWGNIIATVLQCTDFIKSPALQKALETGFDPATLSDGKTTLYVIIPADKLQSHARWLRLVTTTTMRAVVRKPNKRVCFLLDEFAALGYLPEIETALSTYAGFEVTVWTILQSLSQLQTHYKDNWETFIGNSTIRQFFSVNDNFTANYVSKAIGETTNVTIKRRKDAESELESNHRALVTPDELRRGSGQFIFAFMAEKPVTYYEKLPYYKMPELATEGKKRFDDNPYIKN